MKDAEGRELRIRDYYGTKDLTSEDVEYLFDDYYDERGWTRATSIPSREKLEELGLGDIARDLGLTATGPAPRTR
ncbi:MAG: aldehyde ferredoxin oxidoreductase C-terminal domain-containing protein [Dehalococcoidia bacterium]|nr:aldehyde ferredoxin oxidoreductase C-terminal domain-containing protein [Dehalococcoidia bacterium]